MLKKICEEMDIRFLDMNQLILKNSEPHDWLFVDRSHLTDLGNQRVAESIKGSL